MRGEQEAQVRKTMAMRAQTKAGTWDLMMAEVISLVVMCVRGKKGSKKVSLFVT